MLKKGIFIIGVLGLTISSCIKHEVIPAPTPKVDLYCYFAGNIGGDSTEFTQNVDYEGVSGINYEDNFGVATTKYYFTMSPTGASLEAIGVMLGSISWSIASGASSPSLGVFNNFFIQNDQPVYTDGADNGFMVMYTDVQGRLWTSREGVVNPQDVLFTDIRQDSDEEGDYSMFRCDFNCHVYRDYFDEFGDPQTDSIKIQNGLIQGWFER